jgi:hypothetical protein
MDLLLYRAASITPKLSNRLLPQAVQYELQVRLAVGAKVEPVPLPVKQLPQDGQNAGRD